MDEQEQHEMTPGQIVRRARMERGLRQTELARYAGSAPTYICRIEKDGCPIGASLAARLAKVLNLDINLLLKDKYDH